MRVKAGELSHDLLHEFERAEGLGVLEVGRRQREERRVVDTIRILEFQVVINHSKQLVSHFLISDLVLNECLQILQFDVALRHRVQMLLNLLFNEGAILVMEHRV